MLNFDIDATASINSLVVDFLRTRDEYEVTNMLRLWNTFKAERRHKLAPDLITSPVSTSTYCARITTDHVMSTHRVVLLRLIRLADCSATFPPRVLLQQQRQRKHMHIHSTPPCPDVGARGGSSNGSHTTTGLTASQTRKSQSLHHVQCLHSVAHMIAPVVSASTDQS